MVVTWGSNSAVRCGALGGGHTAGAGVWVDRGAARNRNRRRPEDTKGGPEEVVEAADQADEYADHDPPGRGFVCVIDPEAEENEASEGGCQLDAETEAPVRRVTCVGTTPVVSADHRRVVGRISPGGRGYCDLDRRASQPLRQVGHDGPRVVPSRHQLGRSQRAVGHPIQPTPTAPLDLLRRGQQLSPSDDLLTVDTELAAAKGAATTADGDERSRTRDDRSWPHTPDLIKMSPRLPHRSATSSISMN